MMSVAQAVMYLHERKICHLDIKPDTILLTGDGKAKLADMSLSQDVDVTGESIGPMNLGAFFYVAPEQLLRDVAGLPADIWSFGTILWQA